MNLTEYLANRAFALPPGHVSYWQPVVEWCLGGNDHAGTCPWCEVGNLHALVTTHNGALEVMTEGEILNADRVMTGFDSQNKATDHGAYIQDVLNKWYENGWPGDPTMRPLAWGTMTRDQVPLAVAALGAALAWVMLPRDENGQVDLSDAALDRGAAPEDAHGLLIVDSDPGGYTVVSWARIYHVSNAWWDRYGKPDMYWAHHNSWVIPGELGTSLVNA